MNLGEEFTGVYVYVCMHMGGVEIYFHTFLAWHYIDVCGQLHAPAALLRVASPGSHWAPKPVWAFLGSKEKSFVALLCTDCTISSFVRHVLFEEVISRICLHKPHIHRRDCG